jgi:integrase
MTAVQNRKKEKLNMRGAGCVFLRGGKRDQKGKRIGGVLWIRYYRNGKPYSESAHTTVKTQAETLLKKRMAEIANEQFMSPKDRRVTVAEIYRLILDDYQMNNRASHGGAEQRWNKRLKPYFGDLKASQVSTELLNRFVLKCQADKLANATINRDLAALKRAFNLAYRSTPRMVQQVPVFPHLKEAPPRKGFVEQAQYVELCKHATDLWLRSMLAVGYSFGFRKGELLDMRVNQVDLINRTIRLWRGETKSGEPRLVKMTQEVTLLLTACVGAKGSECHVFTRENGKPVLDFRDAWETLCKAATLEGLLFHDLRRSAVRNMIRRGVSERVAMQISGHKTRSVFDRYNVVSEADLTEAAWKIEQGASEVVSLENSYNSATMTVAEKEQRVPTG